MILTIILIYLLGIVISTILYTIYSWKIHSKYNEDLVLKEYIKVVFDSFKDPIFRFFIALSWIFVIILIILLVDKEEKL